MVPTPYTAIIYSQNLLLFLTAMKIPRKSHGRLLMYRWVPGVAIVVL